MSSIENESYTKKEVTKLLGIAEATVYSLARQGVLEVAVSPSNVKGPKRYTKSSVERYKSDFRPSFEGLKIQDFAKQNSISNQRVYFYIKKLNLELDTVRVGKKEVQYLNTEQLELLKNELSKHRHRGTRSTFYNQQLDVALLQKFMDPAGNTYRISVNQKGDWGFYLDGKFYHYNVAINQFMLTPCYSIHMDNVYNPNYLIFNFNQNSYILHYILDFLYPKVGIENLHLYVDKDTSMIELSLKTTPIVLPEGFNGAEFSKYLKELNQACENGKILYEDNSLNFELYTKSLTVEITRATYDLLQQRIKSEGLNASKVVEKILRENLESE